MLQFSILGLLITSIGTIAVQLPVLTGPYPVGTIGLELIDYSRLDSLAPTPQPRDLMVSLYYPTSKHAINSGNYTFAPYITPITASALSTYIGTSPQILNVTIQSYLSAPLQNIDFPVLIFSPGFGGSRIIYTALLENLASRGWIIIAVDHTYDSVVVEFPDGRNISWIPALMDDFPTQMPGEINVRVADVEFVARNLHNSSVLSQIPGLVDFDGNIKPLHTDRIGIFGHSLGGATAAQAVSTSTKFPCGVNIDGGIYGPVTTLGTNKPFLQIEAANHNLTDTTTAEFYKHVTGFKRDYLVDGTVHLSFTDFSVLRELLGNDVIPETMSNLTQFGSIEGKRLMDVETRLMDEFFGVWLKGKEVGELDEVARGIEEVWVPME